MYGALQAPIARQSLAPKTVCIHCKAFAEEGLPYGIGMRYDMYMDMDMDVARVLLRREYCDTFWASCSNKKKRLEWSHISATTAIMNPNMMDSMRSRVAMNTRQIQNNFLASSSCNNAFPMASMSSRTYLPAMFVNSMENAIMALSTSIVL